LSRFRRVVVVVLDGLSSPHLLPPTSLPAAPASVAFRNASLDGDSLPLAGCCPASAPRGDRPRGRFDGATSDCRGDRYGDEPDGAVRGAEEAEVVGGGREGVRWLRVVPLIGSGVLGGSAPLVNEDGVLAWFLELA
jgi:hypothetical protein